MSKNKYCVATVVFPNNIKYLHDYFRALSNQTFALFDVLLFNDGIQDVNHLMYEGLTIRIVNCTKDSIAGIREQMINYLFNSDFEFVTFIDSDDYIPDGYIANNYQLLKNNICVANDLTIVNESGSVKRESIWSSRLVTNATIPFLFLKDKNILGFGNTSVRKSILKKIEIPSEIVAVDWFYFSKILEGLDFTFTSTNCLFYRQHESNLLGSQNEGISADKIRNILNMKLAHYKAWSDFEKYFLIESIINDLANNTNAMDFIHFINKKSINFFWLEEINYYYEFKRH